MPYPNDSFFDIETLVNVSQAETILILGDCETSFLQAYQQQKALLNQACYIKHIRSNKIETIWQQEDRFDIAIAIDLFEHIDKTQGMQVLARLRDVICAQYCICLPLFNTQSNTRWHLSDLFSFGLKKVASYQIHKVEYGLFKYNIKDYKKTPDWLNASNWANPELWNKYRW